MTQRRHCLACRFLVRPILRRALSLFFDVPIALALLFGPGATTTTFAATPQEQAQARAVLDDPKPVLLEPGKPLERELKGGEKQTYEVRAEAGLFLHAEVEQLGIDVALTLYAPDGEPIATMDSPNDNFGPEKISVIVETPGIYRLEIASGDKNVPEGRYRVTADPLRAPNDQDRARISGERLLVEAINLQAQGTKDSLRSSIQKYLATLPLWHTAGDMYEEGLAKGCIGEIFNGLGESQRALEYDDRALSLFQSAGDRSGESAMLNNIGGVYSALGEKQKALGYYTEALPLVHALGDRLSEARTLSNIGLVYSDLGETQKALEYYSQALPLERALGDSRVEATTLGNIGSVYSALGEKHKALEYYGEGLALERALRDRVGEARTLGNIGLVYSDLGEKQKALDYYNKALVLARELGNRAGEATILNNIGRVYNTLGEQEKALDYYTQSLPLRRASGDKAGEAVTLNNIGLAYAALGEEQKALDYYTQSLPLRRAVGDKSGEGTSLQNIAQVYHALGDWQKSLEFYSQALLLFRAVGNRSKEALALTNMGSVYDDLGEEGKALEYYSQALPLRRAVGDQFGEANTLSLIGFAYHALGEKQKALDYYNQALSLERAVGDRPGEAATLNYIGTVYQELGKRGEAMDHFERALLLDRAIGNRPGEAITLNNMGQLYFAMEDKQKALEFYNQALSLVLAVRSPLGQAHVLRNLMSTWRARQQPETAIFFGKHAVNNIQKIRSNIRGLEPDAQQSFLKSSAGVYRELADILISLGRLSEAEKVLGLLKDEEYFEFIRRDGNAASSLTAPVTYTKEEEALNAEFEKNAAPVAAIGNEFAALQAKTGRTAEEEKHLAELADELTAANEKFERFLNSLYEESGKSREAQERVKEVNEQASGMQRVVRKLGNGTMALYTLVGEEKYRIIVITPNVMVAEEYAIKADELREKVFEFREALLDPKSNPLPKAQELYKILIGPAEKDLEGAKAETLMWSLDDVLRYLPMAALHDGHEYLVEKYRNTVFTPASVPSLTEHANISAWQGLGMGVSKSYGGFSALPAVPDELHRIIREKSGDTGAGVLPGQVMLDETFTAENMEKALEKKFPLVHIASHFDFTPGSDTDSFLLLGGKDEQGGHLTLGEIRKNPRFNFTDVELLTLSACNTAVSAAAGDGREVDGLGYVAQDKGARAVVASLWGVYDSSTGLLMQEFYKQWTAHSDIPKAEALRQAQLSLLRPSVNSAQSHSAIANYAHPYYWAPFILIGNWQ